MASSAVSAAVEAVCRPVVNAAGWDLEEVRVQQAGRRSVVRLVVDADSGVDLDAVAQISRAVAEALDEQDPVKGEYTLEVTSPGVDRPLTEPRHWRRNTGRLVTTTYEGRGLTARVLAARVLAADDEAVTFEGEPAPIPVADLGPGRVQVEFNRPGQPEPTDSDTDDSDTDDSDTDDTDTDEEVEQ